uniref:L-Fucosyltransferase n=2 Tax=Guillardia theta TaxID=55529 RepID=A0A7S4U7G9_GUITH|mmetsp:Transcript_48638/g.152702  ORF Transcript_48638/g.152702 Transcript_48638/m.152702 type:complete len:652 (+) Transcript_48638:119-2074(+)
MLRLDPDMHRTRKGKWQTLFVLLAFILCARCETSELETLDIEEEARQFCLENHYHEACCESRYHGGEIDCSSCSEEVHSSIATCTQTYISEHNKRQRAIHSAPLLRVALLSPLHWSVHDASSSNPLMVSGKIFGIDSTTPPDTHINVLLSGFSEVAVPLSSFCSLNPPLAPCEFRIPVGRDMLGKGTRVLAARLVKGSEWSSSIGPVAELSFRCQPRFLSSWDQNSCWKGFFASTPRYDACLREDGARMVEWRRRRMGKRGGREGEEEEGKGDEKCLQHLWTHKEWKDVSEEDGVGSGDLKCLGREWRSPQRYDGMSLNVTKGQQVGLVLVLRRPRRRELKRFLLELQQQSEDAGIVVFTEDPPTVASILYRVSSSFQVHSIGKQGQEQQVIEAFLSRASETFSTLCALSGQPTSAQDTSWTCSSSSNFPPHLIDTTGVVLPDDNNQQRATSYVFPRLYGLMGNVLFQTAAALTLAWDLDEIGFHGRRWEVGLPLPQDHKQCAKTFMSSVFSSLMINRLDLTSHEVNDLMYLQEGKCHICHHNLTEDALTASSGTDLMIHGWRQSYKYFWHRRAKMIDAFSLPPHLEQVAQHHLRRLIGEEADREVVSVHIRRGDLLSEKGTLLSLSYYERAFEEFDEDVLFLVFSDDIPW